ncbi:YfhO family protein [Levilactobacillus paucivorans]|nr:YfhO family protein [Levilactobacillus paucivorans]
MKIARHRWPLWLLYTIAFAIIAAASFGVLAMANRTLIWNMDGVNQHYPLMRTFHQILYRQGLGGVAGWSWTFGLGADKLTTLAYYVLGDPFAYVLALLPLRLMEAGYGVLVVVRLYAAGLAFLAFSRCYAFTPGSRLLGTLTYTFTGYSLMIGVHHPFFILPMLWFPLLLLGIERVFAGKGWRWLGLFTGIAVLSNFYFAYILGLGSLCYAVIRYFSLRSQGRLALKIRTLCWQLMVAAITGLLVAGVLLVPAGVMMLQSTRTLSTFANGLWVYPASYYLTLGNAVLTTGNVLNYWAILGMSGLTFLGCGYTLWHWRQYRYLALTLGLIVVGLLFPAVAAFFNVMSTPSNRWLLLATIPFNLATMVLGDHLFRLTKGDRRFLVGLAAALILVVYASNGFVFSNPRRNLITYGLFLALVVVVVGGRQWSRRWALGLLGTLVGLNLISNAWGYYDPDAGVQATQQLRNQDATRYITAYFDGAQQGLSQTPFSRVNTAPNFNLQRTVGNNMTMAHDLHGVMSYFSVQNGHLGQFSQDVKNAEYAMNSPLGQLDGRTTLNQLLGVKTLFARDDQVQNGAALPYGYHASKRIYPEESVYGLSNGTGTRRLTTSLNFPLIYTQSQVLTQQQWRRLSAVDRERSLTQAAVVPGKQTKVAKASYHSPARTLDYTVMANTIPVLDSPNKVIQYRLKQAEVGQKKTLNDKQLATFGQTLKAPKLTLDQNGLMSHQDEQTYGPIVQIKQNQAALQRVLKANQRIVLRNAQANATGLHQVTSDVQGQPIQYTLTIQRPKQAEGTELYLAFDGISATRQSTRQQLKQQENSSILGNTPLSALTKLDSWRETVRTPDLGDYWVTAKTRNGRNSFSQFGIDNLSDYEPKHNVLLNLGYSKQRRETVDVTFSATRQIDFKKVKLIAMPYGKSYDRQVHAVQYRGIRAATVRDNRVTGTVDNTQSSWLTTSIPYSTGWRLRVDGKTVKTQVVNDGFVGAPLKSGEHHIELTYRTPGLAVGWILTILGSISLASGLVIQGWRRYRGNKG